MKRILAVVGAVALAAALVIPATAHHKPGHRPSPTPIPTSVPTPTPTPVPTPTPTPVPTPVGPAWAEEFTLGMGDFYGFDHVYDPSIRVDPARCSVVGGLLVVNEIREPSGGYATCMALTNLTFDRGYFEARVQYPRGTGFDAAFWLRRPVSVPAPRSEIDILEAYPNDPYAYPGPNRFQSTMHYVSGGSLLNHQITHDAGIDLTNQWHVFGADWVNGTRLTFYLDGVSVGQITADVLPATPMNVVFSLAVGTWSAPADATTPADASMLVDWVRWYETRP